MLIIVKIESDNVKRLKRYLSNLGVSAEPMQEQEGYSLLQCCGNTATIDDRLLGRFGCVTVIGRDELPLVHRGVGEGEKAAIGEGEKAAIGKGERIKVKVGEAVFGEEFVYIGGPCTIEDEEQLHEVALSVKAAGAKILRGGAFKPRTSPHTFQGRGAEGLEALVRVGRSVGIATVSEITCQEDLRLFDGVDMLQVGARNMQNFALLKVLGRCGKPILLKRNVGSTVREWLGAAEYILASGNKNLVLCDRGTRGFDGTVSMDICSLVRTRESVCLPCVADVSHAGGSTKNALTLARAISAVELDGMMTEVNVCPDMTVCDGVQSLTTGEYVEMINVSRAIMKAVRGRN